MKKDIALKPWETSPSFLSCEKDAETILRKIFVQSQPISDQIKRLLVINTKDCLDNRTNEDYKKRIREANFAWLCDNGYVRMVPVVEQEQHAQVQSYITLAFDNFEPSSNTEFIDNIISIEVISNAKYAKLGNFRIRPLKIAGYINSLLNKARLSGIGQLHFVGCRQLVLDENYIGYLLRYIAYHGTDDRLQDEQ